MNVSVTETKKNNGSWLIVDTIIIFPSHLVKSDVICDIPPLRGGG